MKSKHYSFGRVLSRSQRRACAIGCLVLMALLGIAFCLEPSPRGFGTHLQLGLPPCSSYVWFGVPCPSCGMTTSWALVGDGKLATAMRVNSAGTLLCFQAMFSCPWLAWLAWSSQPVRNQWFVRLSACLLAMSFVIALSQWSIRAAMVGFVRQPIDVTANKDPSGGYVTRAVPTVDTMNASLDMHIRIPILLEHGFTGIGTLCIRMESGTKK